MTNKFLYRLADKYSENGYRLAFPAAAFIICGLLLFRVLLIFSYNGEVGGIDNNFVYGVISAMTGHGFYSNPAALPYSVTLYPPLYFQLCSSIGHLLHINPNDPIQVYRLCRGVSLAADCATCLLLCMTLKKRFNLSKGQAWLITSAFACILCVLGYTFSRCDSLLLVFYAATIFILTDASGKKIPGALLLSLLSLGCILSKQNGIILPLLVWSWLLLQGANRIATWYFIFVVLLTTAALFLYHESYDWFFDNTITALQNRIDLSWFYTDIFKRLINSLWAIPLYIAAGLSIRYWLKPGTVADKGLAVLFIMQTVFSLATSLKWGSTAGYFNESFFLSFILIGRKAADYTNNGYYHYSKKAIAWLLPLLLLFFLHTLAQGYLYFIQNQPEKRSAYRQQKEVRDYLQPQLADRYVLDLADPNADFFKTLFYDHIAVPNMDMVDCCELPDHNFDYSSLKKDLTNGTIGYIITRDKIALTDIWGVPLQSYVKDSSINGYTIYRYQ